MKINLQLNYSGNYQWSQYNNVYFIGYCFDNNNRLYQHAEDWKDENLADKIEDVLGAFAAIQITDKQAVIWVDTIASFPLFYKIDADTFTISTSPFSSQPELKTITEDYTRIYCTEGEHTLLSDWKALLAGHKLIIDTSTQSYKVERYFDQFIADKRSFDEGFKEEFLSITKNWAEQIIQFANGNQIWIPLSGGYDSRLILSILAQEKAPNLHTYTYGREDSPEVQTAKEVAQRLGVKWHFIPYDKEIFRNFFTDKWKQYALSNHHYQSVPHEQDFFALLSLSEQKILKPNFVAIPGHCGDMIAGSNLKSYPIETTEHIKSKYHYHPKHLIRNSGINAWDIFHQWLITNRKSKFIVNSIRVYEYFGGKWMLPMWHKNFIELFYSLEFKEKWEQKAYIELCFTHYFKPLNIDLWKLKNDRISVSKNYKDYIKTLLPAGIVRKIQLHKRNNSFVDPCNLHILYDMLYNHMKDLNIELPKKDRDINRLHAFYMLHLLKNNSFL